MVKSQTYATQGEVGSWSWYDEFRSFWWNNSVMGKKMGQRVAVQAVFHELSVLVRYHWLSIPSIALDLAWCVSGIHLLQVISVSYSYPPMKCNPAHPTSNFLQEGEAWRNRNWPSPSRSGRLIGKALWPRILSRSGCCAHAGAHQIEAC